jgi:hypothetical protein
MEVKGDTFRVTYDPATSTVIFQGSMRLLGTRDYDQVRQLVSAVVEAAPEVLILNLRPLRFLNSLGTYLLMGFILKLRDRTNSRVVVHGLTGVHWQERTFADFKRLMPDIELRWDEQNAKS